MFGVKVWCMSVLVVFLKEKSGASVFYRNRRKLNELRALFGLEADTAP